MTPLFLFFLLFNIFNAGAYINADILDESEFIKKNEKDDSLNLLNYMQAYYSKMNNCCNDTPAPSPSPSPHKSSPFKWRGIVYMEVLDILENNVPELQIT